MKTNSTAGSRDALVRRREPLLLDLECLAHELECDCNYNFTGLRDSRGEPYTRKLARLREQLGNIDAMIEESRQMVMLLRECYRAIHAVSWVIRRGPAAKAYADLAMRLAEMDAVRPMLKQIESVLEECDLCHDKFPLSQVEAWGCQILCRKCKSPNAPAQPRREEGQQ